MNLVLPFLAVALTLGGCAEKRVEASTVQGSLVVDSTTPRSFRMGFSGVPPRMKEGDVVKNIWTFAEHADGALDLRDVPWKRLMSGETPDDYLKKEVDPLYQFYRSKGMPLFVTVEPADGIDRAKEARELREMGRSLAEPAVKQVYVDFVEALARREHPDYMGLAVEVNLMEKAMDPKSYQAIVVAANEAAKRVRAVSPGTKLYVSAQVDLAWGRILGDKTYVGCEALFKQYPFIDALGVSSYPAFGWAQPEDIPHDYYTRILGGRHIPVIQVEGGWPSTSTSQQGIGSVTSDPGIEARYIKKLGELLSDCDAKFVGLLLFADLDVEHIPELQGTIVPLFATMGVVGMDWKPKPALAVWDQMFHRPLKR